MAADRFLVMCHGFIFVFSSTCFGVVIHLPERNTYLPGNSFINNTASTVYQCIDICSRFRFCKSINFIKEEKNCMLNHADSTTTDTVLMMGSHYVEKQQFPEEITASECTSHNCSMEDLCVTNGSCSQWNCGPPEQDPDAIFQYSSTIGYSKASYRCKVMPRAGTGSGEMQCSLDGKWTDHGIVCPRFVNCGHPPLDPLAITEYSSTVTFSTATYKCKRPHQGQTGSGSMECSEQTGSWTDHGISCADTCLNPPTLRTEQQMTYKYTGRIKAQYSCSSFPDSSPIDSCPLSVCTDPDSWTSASLSCSPQDCRNTTGNKYYGRVSCTVSGRTCQRWDSNYPHATVYRPTGNDLYTNYCRILDVALAWCYTTDPTVRWEYCPIQDC